MTCIDCTLLDYEEERQRLICYLSARGFPFEVMEILGRSLLLELAEALAEVQKKRGA